MTSALAAVPGQRRPDGRGDDLPSAVLSLAEADADAAADALHDGALQALVVARYAADAAVRGGDPAAVRDAVQEALVALRRSVWLLRPRGDRGLLEALQQLAAHVVQAGGAPVTLDVDTTDPRSTDPDLEPALDGGPAAGLDADLSPSAATAAYRLVQRAAGDLPLTVRIRRTATGLRIALDVPLTDPAGEALRARAVGGALLATRDGASLHLPLSRSTTPLHAVRPEVLR